MDNLNGGEIDSPGQNLIQISQEEIDIINDIRGLRYGRISLFIQDGIIFTKEVTKIVRRGKNNKYKSNDNYET